MSKQATAGFTLIELLVVMAVISMLLSLAVPIYFKSVDKTKEAVLKENLSLTRQVIDKYYGDNGKYPDSIETLVNRKYLRALPFDPITDSHTTWVVVPPQNEDLGKVFDIKSGAAGAALDGSPYNGW